MTFTRQLLCAWALLTPIVIGGVLWLGMAP